MANRNTHKDPLSGDVVVRDLTKKEAWGMGFNDAGLGQAMGESHNREMALHAQNQARHSEIEIKQLKERVDLLEQHIRILTTAFREVHTVLTIMTSEATQDDEAH